MIQISKENANNYLKSWWSRKEPEEVTFLTEVGEEVPVSFQTAKMIFSAKGHSGVPFERLAEIAKSVDEKKIKLNPYSAKMLFKKEHSRSEAADLFLENYNKIGNTKCLLYGSDWTKEALTEGFSAIPRFKGRVPMILEEMAAVADTYNIEPDTIVSKFNVDLVKELRKTGIPTANIVLLYTKLDSADLLKWKDNADVLEQMANLLSKGILKDEEKYTTAAKWVSTHFSTDREVIDSLLENPTMFRISSNSSVEKVRVQMSGQDALSEIKKIEKHYKKPKFKFKECRCELKMSKAQTDKYVAYILKPDDPRQVMLGHETNCCQVYGDAGETAMLHGLLNPRAGFWGVFDAETEKLRCQAEIWEYDEDTLVFDNIEFANDTELSRYKEIIGEWLVSSPYKNICMGLGYNAMSESSFHRAPDFTPPVTAREIYVMSYEEDAELPYFSERTAPNKRQQDSSRDLMKLPSEEVAAQMLEEGRIDYYDYLYADVDDQKGIVYLKENFKVDEYFEVPKEKQELYESKFSNSEKEDRKKKYASVIFGKKKQESKEELESSFPEYPEM